MLCFNLALEEQRREGSHMQSTAAQPSFASPPQQEDGDNFLLQFIRRVFFF